MQVLESVADRHRWLRLWQECGREPFAHPAYGELFAQPGERPVALVTERDNGFALVPVILRPIPAATSLYDAVSPYGYGGPFRRGDVCADSVLADVEAWLAREGLCSAFLRLSLDVEVSGAPGTTVADVADNVVVDLRRDEEEIWRGYEHKVRKNVKKALRAGCTVRRDDRMPDVDAFVEVYAATMHRRDAAAWYHFDRDFFAQLAESLTGNYSVFWVHDGDGRVVSVELVLESDDYLYSFLGGTHEDAFPMSPNDLLKHEVSLHGQRTGRTGFVLGGGYQRGDGIFRYKRSFDPRGVRSFRAARMIGRRDRYDALVDEHSRRSGSAPNGGFFPAYRAPVESAPGTNPTRSTELTVASTEG
ncbi:GNAT family N-acetyltransferase [Krasilnikovia sp. MM14-A1259]|uniref:GNAT family N-acetyltransferase n=1 Tax=Krasilnikovia sp. MM14-A1259 TaxID=3373539 RepID=UPI0037F66E1C